MKNYIPRAFMARFCLLLTLLVGLPAILKAQAFVHPGCLESQADFDRMKAKVQAGEHPWIDSWNILVVNSHAQSNYVASPVGVLVRGTGNSACSTENYSHAYNDAAAVYQLALRWKITGDDNFANAATNVLNQWANTCTNICGDSNAQLAAGIYGYEFACAADIMRSYTNWTAADVTKFQVFMVNVFYPVNHDFLIRHNNTCDSHYWANWDLCNMASIMAIGILCDDTNLYSEAVTYFKGGIGTGNIDQTVYYLHPGYLGQGQEEGRDQGHSGLEVSLLGVICQMAWNQGDDLFGYENNRVLSLCEYFAKYNLGNDVPYVPYNNCEKNLQTVVSSVARGDTRPAWDLIYNHYVNLKGLAAPWSEQYAALVRPEGGGGNYGPNSGGYDQLGFTTLTQTQDPISTNATPVPSALMAAVRGQQVTVSWWGSAYATSYNIKRATVSGGPYTTIATAACNSYVDAGLTLGTTYYYVVSDNNPGGESADSVELATAPDDLLSGTIIGTTGSYNNTGATGALVYDDSLATYYDAVNSTGDWAGLDLGAGVSSVITRVEYCPRIGFGSRMVGGAFQGANDAGFTNPVTLFTISTAPSDGVLTSQTINNGTAFRYVRYVGPANGYCNVAEVKFYGNTSGLTAPAAPSNVSATTVSGSQINLSWTASTRATSYDVKRSTTSGGPYVVVANVTDASFNDNLDLALGTTYYYVVTAVNSAGKSADSSEIVASTALAPEKITGTIIGSSGSWGNSGNTITNVFDGNLSSYYDAVNASGDWAGLDLGAAYQITQVQYCPRVTWGSRMVGGLFQGANDAGFTNPVTLFTVGTAPSDGVMTAQSVTDTGSYRYVRYLGPGSGYCNVAEVEFDSFGTVAAPAGLAATAGDAQVALSWTAVGGATSYNVKRSTTSGGTYTTITSVTTPSYTDTGLVNGTTYYYVVTAMNYNSESASSAEAAATPQVPPPSTPTGLTATAASNSQINLTWTASAGATSYNVKRATVSSGPYTTVATNVISTSYSDTGLTASTTYYYVASAVNGGGESANSTEAGATTQASGGALPAGWSDTDIGTVGAAGSAGYSGGTFAVQGAGSDIGSSADSLNFASTNLNGDGNIVARLATETIGGTANDKVGVMMRETTNANSAVVAVLYDSALGVARLATRASTGATMSWISGSAMTVPQWFKLARAGSSFTGYVSTDGTTWTQVGSSTATMAAGISAGLAVCSRDATALNVSTFDNVSVTGVSAPAAPTGVVATAGDAQAGLSWSASSGATSYNVKRATVNGGPYTTITNVATTGFTDSGLVNGTIYYYVVSALNAGGESGDSTQASATPQVAAPSAPTGLAAVPGNQQATLNWTASSGATSYNVKRSTTSGSGYATVTNVTDTSVVDSGLSNDTTYYYVVSAANAGGESANSAEVSVTPTDLFGWWKFDETSGTTAADSSGGNNGTLQSGATWTTGISSNAVHLDGSANGYVSLPAGLVSTLTDFSVSVWVKVDTNATWARVFDFGSGTGTYMFLAPASGGNTVRYAITTSSSGGEQQINNNAVLATGGWHHLAVTLSGTVGILYVDGTAVGTNSSMTLNPSSLGSTTQNYIGKSQWADPNLTGSVDDFRIYSRALSAAEVSTLAAAGLPSPWAQTDIGAVGLSGTADEVNGTFTLHGAGTDVTGSADALHFVYQPSSGDCENSAQVVTLDNTGSTAKAGVMIRESLDANAREAGVWMTPGSGVIFTYRSSTGGSTSTRSSSGKVTPYWVRLTRTGNTFRAYYSANGTSWTQFGGNRTINMSSSAYVGMGVESGATNTLNTATMDNVTPVP